MPHIDYFCATLSPYVYLSGTRPAEVAAKHGATLTYKPLDIMALFGRTGGTPPKDRHPSRVEYRAQELTRWAARLGVPFNLKPAHWPTNGAPAAYALIAAQADGGGDVAALLNGIGRACWAEEKDIAEDTVIRDCLMEAGFDAALADKGLMMAAETYAANLEEAVGRGVFGTPFFITDDDARFWGQDRIDMLDAHLSRMA
jgi:2-hydroxychromene-2-carboxylate isomerase